MTPMHFIEWFQTLLADTDTKFVFGIAVYAILTLFDFVLGFTIAAINKQFKSRTLEIGIVKKVSLILFLIFCFPVSTILGTPGITGLWVAIVGMIVAELYSVIENLRKIDPDDGELKILTDWIENYFKK